MASLVTPIATTRKSESATSVSASTVADATPVRSPRVVLLDWVKSAASAGLTLFVCLLAVGLVGMSPVNTRFRNVAVGTENFVYTDGLQSKIFVPVQSHLGDWRDKFPAGDFPNRDPDADYVAFSWGDCDFCTTTSEWSQMSVGTTLKALFAPTSAVMHVEFCRRPPPSARYRRIVLTKQHQAKLTEYLYQSFERWGDTFVRADDSSNDCGAYYKAKGTFCLLNNGNNWTGTGLKRAGVRTGMWTPLTLGLAQVSDD